MMKDGESVFSMTKAYEKTRYRDQREREKERERLVYFASSSDTLPFLLIHHLFSLFSSSLCLCLFLIADSLRVVSFQRYHHPSTTCTTQCLFNSCARRSRTSHTPTHTHSLTYTTTRAGAALIACVTMVPKDPQKGNGQLLSYRLPRRRPRLEVLALAA